MHKDKLYAVNGNTGKAQLLATVPATIGGVATNPSEGFNSLAINTTDGILYFVSNGNTSKAVFGYNMRTNTFLLIETDMIANRGVTSLGRNLGSAGGFYANGRYFFGVENSNNGNSAVYSIATANNGTTFVGNAVVEVNSYAYQWGDFAIDGVNGIMYTGASGIGYQALDLGVLGTVGDEAVISSNSNASFGQLGIDLGGQFYYVFGNTAGFATIDLVTGVTGTGKSITLDGTTTLADGSYDAGGIIPYDSSIGDSIWNDLDGNGIQDAGELGISGVTIELYDDIDGDGVIDNGGNYNNTDTLLATDTTDANGTYKFEGLIPGNYIIKITDTNNKLILGNFSTAGGDTQTAQITQSQQFINTVDFGYHIPNGTINGSVLNTFGNPIVGAQVKIVDRVTGVTINDINGNPLLVTVNSSDGTYSFLNVPVGDYNIVEINPNGYISVSDIDTSDDGDTYINADVNDDSIPVTVADGEIDADNNFVDMLPITANNDINLTPMNGIIGGIAINNIASNDIFDGTPFTLGNEANITTVTNNTPLVIDVTTGSVTVPSNTPAGTYTETYTLCENLNPSNCDTANVTVTVLPQPVDDNETGTVGTSTTVNILDNENNIDPSSIRLIDNQGNHVTQLVVPNEGTWVVNSDGTVTFTPLSGFTGDPTPVRYTGTDIYGNPIGSDASITIDYKQVLRNDSKSGIAGNPVSLDILGNDDDVNVNSINLLAPQNAVGYDTDNDGDIDKVVVDAEGVWIVDNNGFITFTPENGFVDSPTPIKYNVKDAYNNVVASATVTINYQPSIAATDDGVITITRYGATDITDTILDNDAYEGNITITILQQPEYGSVEILYGDDGRPTILYTPKADINGVPDSFRYAITDSNGQTANALVRLDVQCGSSQTSDGGDAMGVLSALMMMLITLFVGMFYVRRDEKARRKV